MSNADETEAICRAEWLHKHKAHKDWVILSVSEIALIKDELLLLEQERDEAREALEYIAYSNRSALHIEDYAKEFLARIK